MYVGDVLCHYLTELSKAPTIVSDIPMCKYYKLIAIVYNIYLMSTLTQPNMQVCAGRV